MTKIVWDGVGDHTFETGVDRGVLYIPDGTGAYSQGYGWNGLTGVDEKPTGAAATPQYADNQKYLNLVSAEQFEATISAFTYPDEFAQCDGTAEPVAGVRVGQQPRKNFGVSYRTLLGNDVEGTELGYLIHLVYGGLAAPSEKNYQTVNDTPSAIDFSWDVTTSPVNAGGTLKPTASLVIDSTKVAPANLAAFENILYGTAGTDPRLPLPAEVVSLFTGTLTVATPVAPTYNATTHVVTIPTVTGLEYTINGEVVTGDVTITTDTVISVNPLAGYKLPDVTDNDWLYSAS